MVRLAGDEINRVKVALVGRPNVGKSTLFNRLVGAKLALVDATPGLTRDRKEAEAELFGLEFIAIDTAGFEHRDEATLQARMWDQTEKAIEQAAVVVFVLDGAHGITPQDESIAAYLRTKNKPIICCVNKADVKAAKATVLEAYGLGFEGPIEVASSHNLGMEELYNALVPYVPMPEVLSDETSEEYAPPSRTKPIKMAIVGRPNVGKSSLVNAILKEDRVLVGPEAGITRDSITLQWQHRDTLFELIDTAGLRKKARVEEQLEYLSTHQTKASIIFAPIVLVVLDVTRALEKQDLVIVHDVYEEGRCVIIGLNKWDLIPPSQQKAYLEAFEAQMESVMPQTEGIPSVPLSAKTGFGLHRVFDVCLELYAVWEKKIPTAALNRWLAEALETHQPPLISGRRIKIRYMTQKKTRPPTFVLFTNVLENFPESYLRYLRRKLRYAFDLPGVPLRLQLRKTDNPYHKA